MSDKSLIERMKDTEAELAWAQSDGVVREYLLRMREPDMPRMVAALNNAEALLRDCRKALEQPANAAPSWMPPTYGPAVMNRRDADIDRRIEEAGRKQPTPIPSEAAFKARTSTKREQR